MLEYVLFCFVCYGITVNLVYSKTPKKFAKFFDDFLAKFSRNPNSFSFFVGMFECVKCTGFWVGTFFSLFLTIISLFPWPLYNVLWAGFLSSGSSWFLDGLRKD